MINNIESILDSLDEDMENDITDHSDHMTTISSLHEKIPNLSSEKLCELIVAYRYLNANKDLAVASMHELSRRRLDGDNFNYELYIENALDSLPKLDFSMPDLRSLISQINKLGAKIV